MQAIHLAFTCLFALLTLATCQDAQKLRRENDLLHRANDTLDAEARLAWQHITELRATLAAVESPQPDPTLGIQFIDQ
jgi:hypothetical protein